MDLNKAKCDYSAALKSYKKYDFRHWYCDGLVDPNAWVIPFEILVIY